MGWKDLFRSLWIKDTEMEKYMFLIVGKELGGLDAIFYILIFQNKGKSQ